MKEVKLALADALWVLSFAASWGLLIAYWNTRWAFLFVPYFVGHLGGLSEFVHQAVHRNLFARSRSWNRFFGRLAAAMLSMDFDAYRTFHLAHHRFVNTPNDPERAIYADPALLDIAAGWKLLPLRRKLARILRLARYVAGALGSFGGKLPFVRAVRWSIPVLLAATGMLAELPALSILAKLIVIWYLPLFLLLWVDIVFAQSEHYGTEEVGGAGVHGTVPTEVQYALSWNLGLPAPAEFLLLKRNIHAEHHVYPYLHWTQARDQGAGRKLPFKTYLRRLWQEGPRTITSQP